MARIWCVGMEKTGGATKRHYNRFIIKAGKYHYLL